MHILMVAWGSRGDVAPYVALGRGLAAAGHRVSVGAADGFRGLVEGAGLEYRPFAISLDAGTADPVVRRWLAGSDHLGAELANMRAAAHRFAPVLARGLAGMVGDADALVSGLLSVAALAPWAARHDRPLVAALLQPMLPTRAGWALTHPALPGRVHPANLAAGWWQVSGMHSILRDPIRQVHRALGVRPEGLAGYLRALRLPTVVGVSPLVVPRPADWPATADLTGYWVDPPPPGYEPPPELADVLGAGDPPVYLGFGSMPSLDVARLRGLVVDAVRRSGRRAVLGGVLHPGPGPVVRHAEGVVSVGEVPHEWLFPRTSGVVCHGGAGTVGAGLRAGVPVAVISHMGDQHYWGRRVHELAVGPAPLHRSQLTAARLDGLLRGLAEPSRVRAAARLGELLRGEDGVARGVGLVEEAVR